MTAIATATVKHDPMAQKNCGGKKENISVSLSSASTFVKPNFVSTLNRLMNIVIAKNPVGINLTDIFFMIDIVLKNV